MRFSNTTITSGCGQAINPFKNCVSIASLLFVRFLGPVFAFTSSHKSPFIPGMIFSPLKRKFLLKPARKGFKKVLYNNHNIKISCFIFISLSDWITGEDSP